MSTQTTSAQTVYCFGTVRDQPYASHMLVYMAQKLRGEERGRLDFVSALRLGGSSRWDYEEENDEPYVHSFELGEGVHTVWFEDTQLTVSVTVAASDEIKRVVKFASYSSGASLSKQVTVSGVKSYEQLQRLMRAATAFASALLREESGPNSRVTHSLYIAEGRQFNKLGLLRRRDAQSLFLKEGEIDTLFNLVDGFRNPSTKLKRVSISPSLRNRDWASRRRSRPSLLNCRPSAMYRLCVTRELGPDSSRSKALANAVAALISRCSCS